MKDFLSKAKDFLKHKALFALGVVLCAPLDGLNKLHELGEKFKNKSSE